MLLNYVFSLVGLFSCVHHGVAQLTNTTAPSTQVHCLKCERVARPDDCLTSVLCSPGEICMSEQYVTSNGFVFFDLGCKLAPICSAAGFTVSAAEIQQRLAGQSQTTGQPKTGRRRRQNIAVHVCEECCEDDFCNNYLCGGHEIQHLRCAGCDDIKNMSDCDRIKICDLHEVCYIEEKITDQFELVYTAGCAREKQCEIFNKEHTVFHPCFHCCNTSFCNVICPTVAPTTSSTTAPTTSTIASTTSTTASTTPTTASTTPTTASTTSTTASTTHTTTPTTPTTASTTLTTTPTTPTTTSTPTTSPTITTTQTTMIPPTICPTFPPLSNVKASQVLNNSLINVGCGGKDDIVFLVDASRHVDEDDEHVFELFTKAFADSLQVGPERARVGYAFYNSRVQEVLHLDKGSNPEIVDMTLLGLARSSSDDQDKSLLGAAVNHVLGDMYSGRYSRSGAKKHLVILTENAIDDMDQAVAAADEAKLRGVDVIVVAVGDIGHIEQQLQKIPSSPVSQHFLPVKHFDGLRPEIENLILSHCKASGPLPTIASDPCAGPKLLNFLGCGAREDITFILDRSGSIHYDDWIKMNQFLDKLIGKFDVSPDSSRIGMMIFNNKLKELIHFKDFSDKGRLLNEMDSKLSSVQTDAGTYTHLALERALQWYQHSSRSDAIKVVVIFTDGGSEKKYETLASALELQRHNVTIFVVGIGHDVDLKEQMILASDPDEEHMLNVKNVDGLLLYMEYLAAVRCRDLSNKSTTTVTPSSTATNHNSHNGR
ncbi:vitrin-like isoform X1 [Haliotis rufescens]|uniref:vitrin-like isoform X1 n=1 Tax=Haliotis rufescens TaxID=6454 RepID=UPI00201F6DA5|nr:vitrin-like isoform X1 [Haliotis rufescens]